MISLDKYSDLISLIQQAAINPEDWDIAIQKLVTVMNGSGAHFITVDKYNGSLIAQRTVNFDEFVAKNYGEYYHSISPRTKFLNGFEGQVCFDHMFIDTEQMAKDEFYNWTSSFDAQYFISANSLGDHDSYSALGIFRGGNAGHVETNEISLLANIWPHLQSALQTSKQLTGSTLYLSELVGSLEILGKAALVLRPHAQVVALNTMAEEALKKCRIVSIQNNVLDIQSFKNRSKFETAFSNALARSAGSLDTSFHDTITLSDQDLDLQIEMIFQPLKATQIFMSKNIPCALILICNLTEEAEKHKIILMEKFLLTNSEASIGVCLYKGMTLHQIADHRKTSIHTIRNQLKILFDKTVVNSQSQLVAKIARSLRQQD